MLVFAMKPGHDGAVAALKGRKLLFSLEAEKDSSRRHARIQPDMLLEASERIGETPDVVALSGWHARAGAVGGGYYGADTILEREMSFFGNPVKFFSSSHERSHIMMAIGMAPPDDAPLRAVLVWEGQLGHLYLLDERLQIVRRVEVMRQPGARWAFLFALADPSFPDRGTRHRVEDAGKLMALAAYGDGAEASPQIRETVDRIVERDGMLWNPAPKHLFRDSPVYNSGVESEATKVAADLLEKRMFGIFADAAREHLPRDVPLYISGGCGLNCDWNARWRDIGQFSSVFVPPCTDDSGSAIGTAIDALAASTGDPHIDWSVYSGLEFEWDVEPDATKWTRRELDDRELVEALSAGRVVAWVQGRWEIGPRALGNRSLLAEPFRPETRDRLNEIKVREEYRPIAPCCRVEDLGKLFDGDFEDPYMLYFRRVVTDRLGAVTHVDGSARVQTVSRETNDRLHDLLSAFAARHGVGILCNTSLNLKGRGFINRVSTLLDYCERRGIADAVVGSTWLQRVSE